MVAFCIWLLSLSPSQRSSMLYPESVFHSLLCQIIVHGVELPHSVYPVEESLGCCHIFTITVMWWTFLSRFLSVWLFSILLGPTTLSVLSRSPLICSSASVSHWFFINVGFFLGYLFSSIVLIIHPHTSAHCQSFMVHLRIWLSKGSPLPASLLCQNRPT